MVSIICSDCAPAALLRAKSRYPCFPDNLSAITCLFEALANLRTLFTSIDEAYQAALAYVLPTFRIFPNLAVGKAIDLLFS
jgi:hypothetical protein